MQMQNEPQRTDRVIQTEQTRRTRTIVIGVILALVLIGLVIAYIKSRDEKVEDANAMATEVQQNPNPATNQSTAENDWQNYKMTAERKIAEHERAIADYKTRMTGANGRMQTGYDNKIEALDQKTRDLKKKLNDYKNEGNTNWEQFRSEFDRDMNELGSSLKGFTVKDN